MCAAISLHVDPWTASARGTVLKGRVCGTLSRLEEAVQGIVSEPEVELRFEQETGSPGQIELRGEVAVRLRLQCQRCLQDFECLHQAEVRVQISSGSKPDEDSRAVDDAVICEPGRPLDVAALVEDEILLSLPFAARCADADCQRRIAGEPGGSADGNIDGDVDDLGIGGQRHNPFAVLAELKRPGPERDEIE